VNTESQKRAKLCPYCGARLYEGLTAIGGIRKGSRNYWSHTMKGDGKIICPRRLAIEDFFKALKN
jgi:predicted nucleic acid-binding Zn ribbon protein